MFPLEFRADVNRQETRVSEDRTIGAGVVLALFQRVTTDGHTVGRSDIIYHG